jgi:hypothetical protein
VLFKLARKAHTSVDVQVREPSIPRDCVIFLVHLLCCGMLKFTIPTQDVLDQMTREDRMNLFRRYFATSRYNRLYIQYRLVRSAIDKSLSPKVEVLESQHNIDFCHTLNLLNKYNYEAEFLLAVNEECEALQKIIEVYDKRLKPQI